ncbi:N-acyl-aromatic-L-amino acid amidohydrolase (carboxylate-forming) B-like isoform X2 [Anguilla anguilla]|uniref:N-acyl-aromatic-L-amino acid amidohydrolase (carboxylate-forming) B-like isoform X1 n=2 Tax=Anguilla anguilla TaxID=7936 RepID=UPI0015B2A8D6|nr:N-acyl-aromatic-L-amino acid amidohydrolase (carboxylate-forming) B-like isoform X1 [Anguilla anguilla]XP_035274917.1 N-acyl-aromatic-L-amino acid amidohydrolase (carboxylate-forming) B-like isoform X2 [Anguilla anguilla]
MMEPVSLPAIPRLALCGGTHGNELSGVYLVREWQRKKAEKEVESVDVVTVIANPRAVQQCRRYIEQDLNRCFTSAILSIPVSDETPYEIVRAQELATLLGPRGSDGAVDLICDLHNTTANMGLCLITNSDCDWIALHIYKHVQTKMSSMPVRLLSLNLTPDESYYLASVGKHDVSIEIGPQPHGLVRADILSSMKEGVQLILEWIRLFNSGTGFEGGVVEVYTHVKNIDYPRDPETQDLTAIIHPQLQDRDFCLLSPGDPLFLSFSGETVVYKGEEPLYPIFVNESAYYEKGTALVLTRMKKVEIPPLRVKKSGEGE